MPRLNTNFSLQSYDHVHHTIVDQPTKAQLVVTQKVDTAIRHYLIYRCPQLPAETILNASIDELMRQKVGSVLREARKANVTNAQGQCAWMMTDAGFGISCASLVYSSDDASQIIPILPPNQPGYSHVGWRAPGRGNSGVSLHMDMIMTNISNLLDDLRRHHNHGWTHINQKYNTQYICHLVSPHEVDQTTHMPYKKIIMSDDDDDGGSSSKKVVVTDYHPLSLKELSTLLEHLFKADLNKYPELQNAWYVASVVSKKKKNKKRKRKNSNPPPPQNDDDDDKVIMASTQKYRTIIRDHCQGKVDLPSKLMSPKVLQEFEIISPNGFPIEFRAPPIIIPSKSPKVGVGQQEKKKISITTAFLAFVPHKGGPSNKKNDCARVSFFQVNYPHTSGGDDEQHQRAIMNPKFHQEYQYLIHQVLLPIINKSNNVEEARKQLICWEEKNWGKDQQKQKGGSKDQQQSSGSSTDPTQQQQMQQKKYHRHQQLKKLVYAHGSCHKQFAPRVLALVKSQPTLNDMRMVATGRYYYYHNAA